MRSVVEHKCWSKLLRPLLATTSSTNQAGACTSQHQLSRRHGHSHVVMITTTTTTTTTTTPCCRSIRRSSSSSTLSTTIGVTTRRRPEVSSSQHQAPAPTSTSTAEEEDYDVDPVKRLSSSTSTISTLSDAQEQTEQLLQAPQGSWTPKDVALAEETIRWWTKHQLNICNDDDHDDDESSTSSSSSSRVPIIIQHCFALLDRTHAEIHASPDSDLLLQQVPYWYSGNYPRATHLINAALDAWRIALLETTATTGGNQSTNTGLGNGNSNSTTIRTTVPSPPMVLDKLLSWKVIGVPLDCRSFGIVMSAIVHCWDKVQAPILCEAILNVMLEPPEPEEENWSTNNTSVLLPDTVAFTTALEAWARSGRPDARLCAQQLFTKMLQLHEERLVDAPPNTVTYNMLLQVLTAARRLDAMQDADQLLQDMRLVPFANVFPDDVSFRLVLEGWLNVDNTARAVAVLGQMVQLHRSYSNDDSSQQLGLDATFFSRIISHLAKQKHNNRNVRHENYQQAQRLYHLLLTLYRESDRDARFQPEVFATRAMLILHAKMGQPAKAEAFLQELEKQAALQGDPRLLPKRGHYQDVVLAWAKSSCSSSSSNDDMMSSQEEVPDVNAAERAARVLLRMVEATAARRDPIPVDNRLVDEVLLSLSKRQDAQAPERAESLLRTLDKTGQLKLGRSSFVRVIKSWSFSCRPDAGERAEALLREMQDRYYRTGDSAMRPHRQAYTAVIAAWDHCSRSRSPRKNKTFDDAATKHMARLVQEATNESKAGNDKARPDTLLYSTALNGYAKRGDGEAAERMIQCMLEDFDAGNRLITPSALEFNLVLLAWYRSSDDILALARAQNLISLMQQRNVRPNKRSQELLRQIEMRTEA